MYLESIDIIYVCAVRINSKQSCEMGWKQSKSSLACRVVILQALDALEAFEFNSLGDGFLISLSIST